MPTFSRPTKLLTPSSSHAYTLCHAGLSEEQITDIFNSAGKVLNFRLVYDRETGRPKGFGFAEYPDAGGSCLLEYSHRRIADHTPAQTQPRLLSEI